MSTTMDKVKELGITKGEWVVRYNLTFPGYANVPICMGDESSLVSGEDALLIADAGNTAQKSGRLPSELLEQSDEAIRLLEQVAEWMHVKRARIPLGEIEVFLTRIKQGKP